MKRQDTTWVRKAQGFYAFWPMLTAMLNRRELIIELSKDELTTVSDALNSSSVEPTPNLFEIVARMKQGEPVQSREAVKVADTVAKTLPEGDDDDKRRAIRSIEEALDWSV